ncbi:MAG: alpha/beta hydrolase [Bacteroidia bacterium]|nr:alpha/beta hydrolase [Bacteroidia bacterium]
MQEFSHNIIVDSINVRYYEAGTGEPLVFLHGFCETSEIFELLIPDLSKSYRVVCIDLPGHGDTGMIPGMHHLEEVARWLNKVLKALGLVKPALVGHSLGGYIGLAYAEIFPKKLKGICLFHSTAGRDSDSRRDSRNKTLRFVEKHGAYPFIRSFVPSLFASMQTEMIERMFEIASHTNKEAILAFTEAMRDRNDRVHVLEGLNIPVLFIIGGHDEFVSKNQSRQEMLKARKGNSCFLESAGHAGFYEAPEKVIKALRGFMEECQRDND